MHFFLVCYFVVVSICFVCVFALWPPALQYQLPALLFVYVLFVLFYCSQMFYLVNQNRNKGEGWSHWETAVHLAVAGGVLDGSFLCCPFPH